MHGADNDEIVLQDTSITFASSVAEECFTIDIVPDDFVENEDTVVLRLLRTSDERITISPETTTIIISNDDSKILPTGI